MAKTPDVDVESLTDELYAVGPDEFVAARTATVKALRAAGRREEAAAFAKLPKPVVAAWAVNVLSRRRPDLVDEVIAATDRLRTAHTKGGRPSAIRDAFAARQDALRVAVDAADELVGGRLSDAQRTDVSGTLEAAAADTSASESVRAGRLTQPLVPPSGFERLTDVAPPPRRTQVKGRKVAKKAAMAKDVGLGEPDARRDHRTDPQLEAEQAAAEADSAGGEADAAQQRVAGLEVERDALEARLDELGAQLSDARRAARQARRVAEQAKRRAEKAANRAALG